MATSQWTGVFSAMVTPFANDGSFDRRQTEDLIETLVNDGIDGIVVGGSTGEFYSQSLSERIELFDHVKNVSGGRLTLIAGTSCIGQSDTIELTRTADGLGYDGCMVLPPMYCLPTPTETVSYFESVASVGLPIMVYNNPARVGVALSPKLAAEIAKLPNIVAYKESARDLYAIAETYYATRANLAHFAGLEPYASALLSRGGSGIVSTISNVCAREVVNYYRAFRENDADALSRNQQVIDQLYHLLVRSGLSNFAFVKSAMKGLNRPGGVTRSPHRMASDNQVSEIRDAIVRIYRDAGVPLKT